MWPNRNPYAFTVPAPWSTSGQALEVVRGKKSLGGTHGVVFPGTLLNDSPGPEYPPSIPVIVKYSPASLVEPEARALSRMHEHGSAHAPRLFAHMPPEVADAQRVLGAVQKGVLVMSYAAGSPLSQVHNRDQAFKRKAAYELLRAVADCEAAGVVHGDIKGDNVVVDKKGHVTLLDFGFSKEVGLVQDCASETKRNFTPSHMAPEQAVPNLAYDAQLADRFSLGMTLFELYAGPQAVKEVAEQNIEGHRLHYVFKKGPQSWVLPDFDKVSDPDIQKIIVDLMHREPQRRCAPGELLRRPCFEDLRAPEIA